MYYFYSLSYRHYVPERVRWKVKSVHETILSYILIFLGYTHPLKSWTSKKKKFFPRLMFCHLMVKRFKNDSFISLIPSPTPSIFMIDTGTLGTGFVSEIIS